MKRNEIRNDPIRDFLVSTISKIKDKSAQYLGGGLLLVGGLIALIVWTSDSAEDKMLCLDPNTKNTDLLKAYCVESDEGYSSNIESVIASVNKILSKSEDSLSLDQKIEKMEEIDISQIESNLIKSLFYKTYGDMLLDSGDLDKAIDLFLKSEELYSENNIYSAKLSYCLSLAYSKKENYSDASTYIKKALSYDFEDIALESEIRFLEGKLDHISKTLSE